MLSRDQVLHVARLARLELNEEKQQRMSEELSKVLDHIDKSGELRAERLAFRVSWCRGTPALRAVASATMPASCQVPAKGNVGLFKATGGVITG